MSHSFNKIWIHAIWSTKERQPLILPTIETRIFKYIKDQFIETGCPVSAINGMPDHIHCLFLLSPQKPISDVIKQVKGSSSHFVNEQHLTSYKFSWQTGYAAYSVSESVLPRVFEYIKNQKTHHKTKTFEQEYAGYLKLYGFETKT